MFVSVLCQRYCGINVNNIKKTQFHQYNIVRWHCSFLISLLWPELEGPSTTYPSVWWWGGWWGSGLAKLTWNQHNESLHLDFLHNKRAAVSLSAVSSWWNGEAAGLDRELGQPVSSAPSSHWFAVAVATSRTPRLPFLMQMLVEITRETHHTNRILLNGFNE